MKNNNEDFIKKSKKIHFDKFDYSKFEYKGSHIKSILICNNCGIEFSTTPSNNLCGSGCQNCFNVERTKNVNVPEKLETKYPNWKFDFSNYKNRNSKINFICNNNHKGQDFIKNITRYNPCKGCWNLKYDTIKIEKIKSNNLNIIELKSFDEKIKCKCNICNYEIEDTYRALTYKKYKCDYCILLKKSKLLKDGVIELIKINSDLIHLRCKDKGHEYKQERGNLLDNKGCNQCYLENKVYTKDDILKLFNETHGIYFKYDFDTFINMNTKMKIECKKGHIFYQRPSNHIQGKGCSICKESKGERMISNYLDKKNIVYTRQYKFKDCKNIQPLKFDFYLPEHNICIEFDGIQHFEPIKLFSGEKGLLRNQVNDKIKTDYCINNNINLLRISYLDDIYERLNTLNI